MADQVIPLYNFANNEYNITVENNGKNINYNLFYSYNIEAGYWTLDIRNSQKTTIVGNIPLISGHDLLAGLEYLELGQLALLKTSDTTEEIPNNIDISTDYVLVWRA
jgi:hypothetical protein